MIGSARTTPGRSISRRPELDGAGSTDPSTPADGADDDVVPTLEVRGSVRSAGQPEQATDVAEGHDEVTDEVVLAVRRAVASIETARSPLDAGSSPPIGR